MLMDDVVTVSCNGIEVLKLRSFCVSGILITGQFSCRETLQHCRMAEIFAKLVPDFEWCDCAAVRVAGPWAALRGC